MTPCFTLCLRSVWNTTHLGPLFSGRDAGELGNWQLSETKVIVYYTDAVGATNLCIVTSCIRRDLLLAGLLGVHYFDVEFCAVNILGWSLMQVGSAKFTLRLSLRTVGVINMICLTLFFNGWTNFRFINHKTIVASKTMKRVATIKTNSMFCFSFNTISRNYYRKFNQKFLCLVTAQ